MSSLQYSNDPADCCISGGATSECNKVNFNKEMCYGFMAQRCAREWDSKCDIYMLESQDGGAFVNEVASNRYCRDNTSNKGESCTTTCDINGKNCTLQSSNYYKDPDTLYNHSKGFGDLKDNNSHTLKVAKCDKVCDVLNLSSFGDDDRVLNECLDRGTCGEVMMDVAKNVVSKGIPYTNRRLKKFIDGYISQNNENLQTKVLVGGKGPQINTMKLTYPGPSRELPLELKPTPPSGFIKSREGFNTQEKQSLSTTTIILVLIFLLVVVGGGYQMYKKYKKY